MAKTGLKEHIVEQLSVRVDSLREYAELAAIAAEVACQASDHIRRTMRELGDVTAGMETKSSDVDPVTIVDKAAEHFIADALSHLRPGDGLLGEEGAESSSSTGITWIVDPIDGTVNFIYGIPQYAVSVAACIGENVVAGAVINVATSDLYVAACGSGAFVLRSYSDALKSIEASKYSDLQHALIATGFSYSSPRREDQAKLLVSLLPNVRDIRRFGSAALDLCAVAEGCFDGYYEHGLNAWDFAAGALIAQEAGAKIKQPELKLASSAGALLLASSSPIFRELELQFYPFDMRK